jgi:tungstate transport system substrate-binding protein
LVTALILAGAVRAEHRSIIVASTTSTRAPGLFGHVLPMFKAKTGIDAKLVTQGAGQALETGRRGDADVLFVHAKREEVRLVAEGFGAKRFDVMHNDFMPVAPPPTPPGSTAAMT